MKNILLKYIGVPLLAISIGLTPVFSMGWSPRQTVRFLESDWSTCSGVMIAKEFMLTAAHCDMAGLRVEGKPAEVVKKDIAHDLLLLKVEADCPCADIANQMPEVDEEVTSIGYAAGVAKVSIKGTFQGYLHSIRDDVMQWHGYAVYSMVTEGGSSGGGFFDKYGYLIGIVSAGSKSTTLASSLKMIKEFLYTNVGQ